MVRVFRISNYSKNGRTEQSVDPSTPIVPNVPTDPGTPQLVKSSVLPMTGDETSTASILASIAGAFIFLVGLVGVRKSKEN